MSETKVTAEIGGSMWQILVKPGDAVEADQQIMIMESMKMEIPVMAPKAGTVKEILVEEGAVIAEGDPLAILVTA